MGFNAEEYYRSLGGTTGSKMPQWLKDVQAKRNEPTPPRSPKVYINSYHYPTGEQSVPMSDKEASFMSNQPSYTYDSKRIIASPFKGALNQKDDQFTLGGKRYQWKLQQDSGQSLLDKAKSSFGGNAYAAEGSNLQRMADTIYVRNEGVAKGKSYIPVEIGSGILPKIGNVKQPVYKGDMPTARYNPNKHPSNSGIVSNPLIDGLNAFLGRAFGPMGGN